MQRIDENTYIDDTLVTCAEYQIFIDEMGKRGKYLQPDHWQSTRYPVGQAKVPIGGVRSSDAKTFCEWLAQHDTIGWYFRLPTMIEAGQNPLNNYEQSPLGYWVVGHDSKVQLAWVGSTPEDPRNFINVRNRVRDANLEKRARDIARKHDVGLDMSIIMFGDPYDAYKQDIEFLNTLATAYGNTYNCYVDFASVYDLIRDIERSRNLAEASFITGAGNYRRDRARDCTQYLEHSLDLAGHLERGSNFNLEIAYTKVKNLIHYLGLVRDGSLDAAYAIARNLHVDVFTLQERIAGRSPAFEGIRLVKERIR